MTVGEYVSSVATGRLTASQTDAIFLPHHPDRDLPAVVYLHGNAGSGSDALVFGTDVLARLAGLGFVCVAPTAAHNWGNATGDSRIDDAVTAARARGASGRPPVFVADSHGAPWALTYATDHPVTCVVARVPAIDLQAIRVADTLSLRASIDLGWGVTYPAALPAAANPAVHTTELAQVHQQLWYASDDAVSANVATYATAVGADLRSVGALGHTAAAIAAADADAMVRFIVKRT